MGPNYFDGDIVFYIIQTDVENKEIAIIENDEIDSLRIKIIEKVVKYKK